MSIYDVVNLNIIKGHLLETIEVNIDDIEFENGKLLVNNIFHDIIIQGDERNIPKKFVKSWDDRQPRILCLWEGDHGLGFERHINDWMLDDVVLVPLRR